MKKIKEFLPCANPKTSSPNNSDEHMPKNNEGDGSSTVQRFTFAELVVAINKSQSTLGMGGSGKVYKGRFSEDRQMKYVAIKILVANNEQEAKVRERQFNAEVSALSRAKHLNLVKLIGYCDEDNEKVVVYEYMTRGSLDTHLHDLERNKKAALKWDTRMKIAADAAQGLNYLHHKMKPPMIYADVKSSNILLGPGYAAKLSDFGLATAGPVYKPDESTALMGTPGYCEPDYEAKGGQLTLKSDIYSFGVVLLELFTGLKSICSKLPGPDKMHDVYLADWATIVFRDKSVFSQMADPNLRDQFPHRGMYHALSLSTSCVLQEAEDRPNATTLVNSLKTLRKLKKDPEGSLNRRRYWSQPPGQFPRDPKNKKQQPETEDPRDNKRKKKKNPVTEFFKDKMKKKTVTEDPRNKKKPDTEGN